jgi:hypothetical protein
MRVQSNGVQGLGKAGWWDGFETWVRDLERQWRAIDTEVNQRIAPDNLLRNKENKDYKVFLQWVADINENWIMPWSRGDWLTLYGFTDRMLQHQVALERVLREQDGIGFTRDDITDAELFAIAHQADWVYNMSSTAADVGETVGETFTSAKVVAAKAKELGHKAGATGNVIFWSGALILGALVYKIVAD